MPAVQNAKDVHQETVSTSTLVAVDIEYNDIVLDGDSSRTLRSLESGQVARGPRTEKLRILERGTSIDLSEAVGENDGASVSRVHDVLDANGNASANDLLHRKGMDDLRTIKGQLSSLRGRDGRKQRSSGDFSRVGGEYAIHLLPDLQLLGLDTDSYQSSTEIRVSASNRVEDASRDTAKVACDDRDLVTACFHFLAQCFGQVLVELVVQALGGRIEVDDMGEIDKLGGSSTVVQQCGHVPAAQLLAFADDLILGTAGDLFQVLGRLEDLGQALAFSIDLFREGSQYIWVLQCVLGGLDVVGADGFDNLVIVTMGGFLSSASGAEEAIGGALEFGVVAAGRADDSGAVALEASSVRVSVVVVWCGVVWCGMV